MKISIKLAWNKIKINNDVILKLDVIVLSELCVTVMYYLNKKT